MSEKKMSSTYRDRIAEPFFDIPIHLYSSRNAHKKERDGWHIRSGGARRTKRRAPKRLGKVPRRCLVRRRRQLGVQWPHSISSSSSIRDVKQQTYSLADDKTQLEDLWWSETQGDEPKKLQKGGCSPSHRDKSAGSRAPLPPPPVTKSDRSVLRALRETLPQACIPGRRKVHVLVAEMLQARAGVGAELDAFSFLLSCYKVGWEGPIATNSIDSSAEASGKKHKSWIPSRAARQRQWATCQKQAGRARQKFRRKRSPMGANRKRLSNIDKKFRLHTKRAEVASPSPPPSW